MRQGEKVLEALCRLYLDADILTHLCVPGAESPKIRRHKETTSMISRLPLPERQDKSHLGLMPMALEQIDLGGYDLVDSSESGPAKGVNPPGDATHVCYCHSTMRHVWNMMHDYDERTSPLRGVVMPPILQYVWQCDVTSATRADVVVANSRVLAKRGTPNRCREAAVIFPPVGTCGPVDASEVGDYRQIANELMRYMRPNFAVRAFNATNRRVVVIGGGEMLAELRAMAGPTVEVLGPQPFDVLRGHCSRCRGLVFPAKEDLRMVAHGSNGERKARRRIRTRGRPRDRRRRCDRNVLRRTGRERADRRSGAMRPSGPRLDGVRGPGAGHRDRRLEAYIADAIVRAVEAKRA